MQCKACQSENTRRFDGELTMSPANLEGLKVPPVYISEKIWVCLDCGFAELIVPRSELQSLKKAKAAG